MLLRAARELQTERHVSADGASRQPATRPQRGQRTTDTWPSPNLAPFEPPRVCSSTPCELCAHWTSQLMITEQAVEGLRAHLWLPRSSNSRNSARRTQERLQHAPQRPQQQTRVGRRQQRAPPAHVPRPTSSRTHDHQPTHATAERTPQQHQTSRTPRLHSTAPPPCFSLKTLCESERGTSGAREDMAHARTPHWAATAESEGTTNKHEGPPPTPSPTKRTRQLGPDLDKQVRGRRRRTSPD